MPTKDEHAALIGLPDKGRRVIPLTKHSSVDTVIYGRDLNFSGDNPHMDFMRSLIQSGYAGEPSGHRDAKMANQKLRTVLNARSQMSHHLDEKTPHEEFMTKFADRAGIPTVESRFKPLRKPGIAHTQSMSDILGCPGARTPRGIRVKEVNSAGCKTDPELQRQESRACTISTKWTRSTLRLGDCEHPGALLEDVPDERFNGHAGQAKKLVRQAKVGSSLKSISVVDKLLYGRDLSGHKTDPGIEFAQKFAGYAGANWKFPKKQDSSPGEGEVPETSTPAVEPQVKDVKVANLGHSVSFQMEEMAKNDEMPSTSPNQDAEISKNESPSISRKADVDAEMPKDEAPSISPCADVDAEIPKDESPSISQTCADAEIPKDESPSISQRGEDAEIPRDVPAIPDAELPGDATLIPSADSSTDPSAFVGSKTVHPKDLACSPPETPTRRSPFAIKSPASSNGSRTPSVSGQRPRWH